MPTYQIEITAELPGFPGTAEEAAERAVQEIKSAEFVILKVTNSDTGEEDEIHV